MLHSGGRVESRERSEISLGNLLEISIAEMKISVRGAEK